MIRHLAKLCLGHVFGQLSGIANLARLRGTDSGIRGSALFIILIAVILFAALAYAVSTSRSKGDIEKETTQMEVARMLSFITSLRSSVHRMVLIQGIPPETLMYNNDLYKRNNGTHVYAMGTPADPSRYVFHPNGGNVTPQNFPKMSKMCTNSHCDSAGQVFTGDAQFLWIQADGVGTDAPDIAIQFQDPTREACILINKGLGIPTGSGTFSLYVDKIGYQQNATTINPEPTTLASMTAGAMFATGRMEYCYADVNSGGSGHATTGFRMMAILFVR